MYTDCDLDAVVLRFLLPFCFRRALLVDFSADPSSFASSFFQSETFCSPATLLSAL